MRVVVEFRFLRWLRCLELCQSVKIIENINSQHVNIADTPCWIWLYAERIVVESWSVPIDCTFANNLELPALPILERIAIGQASGIEFVIKEIKTSIETQAKENFNSVDQFVGLVRYPGCLGWVIL